MPKPTSKNASVPIQLVRRSEWKGWLKRQKPEVACWINSIRFTAEIGKHCLIPGAEGSLVGVVAITEDKLNCWALAALPESLPQGTYRLDAQMDGTDADALMLGWLLGSYRFTRYKKPKKMPATLLPPAACDIKTVQSMATAINTARDMINTPANDMGPEELAAACREVAQHYNAEYREIVGRDLIKENYPAIYEVGKASARPPRLADIRWGDKRHPKVALVGKGVCFDSGGLDIKPSSGMRLMKKDMAGAAIILALGRVIMAANLPVRLRILIPAVENSISGDAYRPLDIINTRKGLTVEVGNTDAEGRLILCDALAEADSEKPDLLIDCATLTGAARTALGTDMPALFTPDDTLAAGILRHAQQESDPLWRLPLWQEYREMLKSADADINSAPDSPYAGAITAALYLKEFITETTAWAHLDMMAWNLKARPGRPVGGEAMALRALFSFISERYAGVKPTKSGSRRKI